MVMEKKSIGDAQWEAILNPAGESWVLHSRMRIVYWGYLTARDKSKAAISWLLFDIQTFFYLC